jgi:hypothetical protein
VVGKGPLPEKDKETAMVEAAKSETTTTDPGDVLTVRGVRKTYEAEGAPVRALRGADLTSCARATPGPTPSPITSRCSTTPSPNCRPR